MDQFFFSALAKSAKERGAVETGMSEHSPIHSIAPRSIGEGEIRTRAREAYIAEHRPWRFMRKRIRAGKHDNRLRAIMLALRDMARPMAAIVADRDEATAAVILKTMPGYAALEAEQRAVVANAILTAIRVGRRG